MNERVIIWGVGAYYNRYREDILQMNVVACEGGGDYERK